MIHRLSTSPVLIAAITLFAFALVSCKEERPPLGEGRYESNYVPQAPAPPPPASEVEQQVRDALLHPDQLVRAERLAGLLRSLGPESVDEVRDAYEAMFIDQGEIELTLFIEWWTRHQPREAFNWIYHNWAGRDPSVVSIQIRTWARNDLEAAKAAVLELNPVGLMPVATEGLIRGWDESGEPGLLDFLVQTLGMSDRQMSIQIMARRRVLQYGIDEAIQWAESIADAEKLGDKVKTQVLQRVASAVAEVDQHKAAAFAERHHGGRYEFGMVRRVAVRWIPKDPLAAMSWLSTLPIDKETKGAVSGAYRSWFGIDRSEAIAWLLQYEDNPEPWMDPCIAHYVLTDLHQDPEASMAWIAKIKDPEDAHDTHMKFARGWHLRDPEAAKDWIAAQGFSEDEVRRIHLPNPGAGRQRRVRAPAEES